jgi:hypothetical protein
VRELERPIGRVWRRMRFQRFLGALVWCLGVSLALAAGAIAAEKLLNRPLPGAEWWPFAIAGGVGLVSAALIALFTGPSRVDAAVAIDHVFHLNERLSTALTLPEYLRESPAGRALLADAMKHVATLDIGSEFAPRVPRRAWIPVIPAALALGLLFVPEITQLRVQARTEEKIDKKVVIDQSKALGKKIAQQRKELDKSKFAEAEKLLAEIEKAAEDLAKAPPSQKDKALVELNKLTDTLKERQKQLGSAEQINRQLQQLKDMSSKGPGDEFIKQLAKGDFMKAAQELKQIEEKLKSGKMTEAEKKQLREQVTEMAKQLQKLANLDERKKQLEEAKKNGGLSKEQFEKEMSKLEEQAKSLKQLQQLASKLGKAQESLQKGDMKKAAEQLGMTQQQLSEMAKQLQEMESLDAAMADLQDAKNGMTGDNLNQLGDSMNFGMGMDQRKGMGNGLGRGRGRGDRPEAPDDTATYTTKVKQQITKGKAKVTGLTPSANPVKGDSIIDIQGEVATSEGLSAEALSNQKIPKNVEKHIRGYFDQINKGR